MLETKVLLISITQKTKLAHDDEYRNHGRSVCGNVKELLRVGLHWHVPFIEDLSETVHVVW